MSYHATSLEQFMLRKGMENEIERQKALPPRWKGKMLFPNKPAAAAFVARSRQRSDQGYTDQSWHHARDMIALTYDYYCDAKEVESTIAKILQIVEGGSQTEQCGNDISVTGDSNEITLSVKTAAETIERTFILFEDQYCEIQA